MGEQILKLVARALNIAVFTEREEFGKTTTRE